MRYHEKALSPTDLRISKNLLGLCIDICTYVQTSVPLKALSVLWLALLAVR